MVTLCWKSSPQSVVNEIDKIEDFRCNIAANTASWPTRWNVYAEKAVTVCDCDAALVSVLGASQNGGTFTVLGSWGPEAASMCSGRVLPSPWKPLPGSAAKQKAWGYSVAAGKKPPEEGQVDVPKALTWKSGSQLFLPYEWHQLLGEARVSETLALHAQLEPMLLSGRLVGALLVVTYAGALPQVRESLIPPGGGGGAAGATSDKGSFLRRFKPKKSAAASAAGSKSGGVSTVSPQLMRGMAAAVAQLAFGPHLQAVSRVCSAAQALTSAPSLQDMSSILSSTVSEVLAAELHVNLKVRVAIVPPLHVQYGYLLPVDSPAAAVVAVVDNIDTPVKRAVSGILTGSFSGQAPLSGPNSLQSALGGTTTKADTSRATPFVLPSSLLMQLLRPLGGNRQVGNGSVHAGGSVGGCGGQTLNSGNLTYLPEKPTFRGIVSTAKGSVSIADAVGCMATIAYPKDGSTVTRDCIHGVNGIVGAVSGMVVANLHAWMQDVERPSSDVALLLMAARGRVGPGGTAPGRPSQGGAGGAAQGGVPACLVAVAGFAALRPCGLPAGTAAAPWRAVNGSVPAITSSAKLPNVGDEAWIRSLDASQRRCVAAGAVVDMSMHRGGYGNVYGSSGSIRFDGVGSGPCVALYMTAQERLPASLLRAVKDRAAGLLELLLPACLSSFFVGPLRTEVDLLAAAASGGFGAGSFISSGLRRILAAVGSGSGVNTPIVAATPSASASATPLPSTQMSGSQTQLSQLQLQMQMQMLAAGRGSAGASSSIPRRGALSSAVDEVMLLPSCVRSPLGVPAGQMGSMSAAAGTSSGAEVVVLLPPGPGAPRSAACAHPIKARMELGCGGGRPRGSDGETTSRLIPMLGSSRDFSIIAQQRWPELPASTGGGGGLGGSAAQEGPGRGNSPCSPAPVLPIPSWRSRTTRGSPGSCGFGAGAEECGLMASMDVTGAMDDVTSMRDNLDVWVHSFWEMLRDTPPNKSGHTHGSYANDDLRYLRLYQRLGSGGAASVYAGVLLGMDVAVKVIEPPPEVDMEALASNPTGGPVGPSEEAAGAGGSGMEAEGRESEVSEEERRAELATAVRQAQMRELVRIARECAVLTTVSHPAIVQVYSYHTRVQVVPGEGPDSLPRLLPVPPGEGGEAQGPLHSVLIMERCDLGSLADALDNGMFKKAIYAAAIANTNAGQGASSNNASAKSIVGGRRTPNQLTSGQIASNGDFTFSSAPASIAGGSAMRAIYLTLLEVALALRHLHSMNLVHCDVKVANILLKSSASDPRGFTCKLSDFGLVNLLRSEEDSQEQDPGRGMTDGGASARQMAAEGRRAVTAGWEGCKPWMRNADAAGTVTHLAPECFEPDRKLDQSVDIYAFGVVMWEVFTRKPPYAEFAPDFETLPTRVLEGLRPRFPSHSPSAYRALAHACWCPDVAQRPTAAAVVACLQSFLDGGSGVSAANEQQHQVAAPGPRHLQIG